MFCLVVLAAAAQAGDVQPNRIVVELGAGERVEDGLPADPELQALARTSGATWSAVHADADPVDALLFTSLGLDRQYTVTLPSGVGAAELADFVAQHDTDPATRWATVDHTMKPLFEAVPADVNCIACPVRLAPQGSTDWSAVDRAQQLVRAVNNGAGIVYFTHSAPSDDPHHAAAEAYARTLGTVLIATGAAPRDSVLPATEVSDRSAVMAVLPFPLLWLRRKSKAARPDATRPGSPVPVG